MKMRFKMVGQVQSCVETRMETQTIKYTSSLDKLLNKIIALPNWVKQYAYLVLREDLSNSYDITKLDAKSTDELVQMFVPTPSPSGRRILQRRFNNNVVNFSMTEDQVNLLRALGLNKRIIDICTENKWSLIKCCRVLIESIEKGYVESIDNHNTANTIYYIAGRIRLGEYLLRNNKLSLDQIDRALYTQKNLPDEIGSKTKIGELLVNLGYIKHEDKEEILKFKDQSNDTISIDDETLNLKEKLVKLKMKFDNQKFENDSIKEDLTFYQDELISKANYIAELERKLENQTCKKPLFKSFFGWKILQGKA